MKKAIDIQDAREIAEMASKLRREEMSAVKAFIAGLEAKDKLQEEQKAAG